MTRIRSRPTQFLYPALVALGVVLGSGCYRVATEEMIRTSPTKPWSVNGVRLGMTQEECQAILSEPTKVLSSTSGHTLQWAQPSRVTITFDPARDNTVSDISGSRLANSDGKNFVWGGIGEEELRAVLPGARAQKYYRPKGQGVISLGRTHTGTSYEIKDTTGVFVVSFRDGFCSGIRAHR